MPNPSAWYLNSAWSKGIARGRVSVRQTAQAECESALMMHLGLGDVPRMMGLSALAERHQSQALKLMGEVM